MQSAKRSVGPRLCRFECSRLIETGHGRFQCLVGVFVFQCAFDALVSSGIYVAKGHLDPQMVGVCFSSTQNLIRLGVLWDGLPSREPDQPRALDQHVSISDYPKQDRINPYPSNKMRSFSSYPSRPPMLETQSAWVKIPPGT